MINLPRLHSDILIIADSFHKFCSDQNIQYFLLGGTALGAARHQGFIPWDDDFDVCMDYENYSKFLELWRLYGSHKEFYLQREGTDEWPLYFSKLRLNNSRYIEREDIGRQMHNGVYIDIMCLNKLSDIRLERWLQFFCAKLLTAEALNRRGYKASSLSKNLIIIISRFIVYLTGKAFLLKFVRSKNQLLSSNLYGHMFGRAPYQKSIIKSQQINKRCLVEFSGRKYFSFSDLSGYLKNRFGPNFMDNPSEKTKASYPSHCVEYIPRN